MSKYTFEEKLEAVLRVLNEGMSKAESAHILGVSRSKLIEWINIYQEHGAEYLMNGGASYDGQFKVMVVEYGNNEEYNTYANKTPIIIPFLPIYHLNKK